MLLENLKNQTRHQHTRLERINGLPATRAAHVALLERFYGYVVPWERRLAELLPANDVLRAGREKSGWLLADLGACGHDERQLAALTLCEDLPGGVSRPELLGACYVLEGSTLGGQFIARHLHERLGVAPGQGDRYFLSYGVETGAKWQAFRAELLSHSSPENDPVIIRAAQETFDKLAAWFAACPEPAAA